MTMIKNEKLRAEHKTGNKTVNKTEEQLDLNPQPLEAAFAAFVDSERISDAVGERLRNNRCPRCDGNLSRITDHEAVKRYCNQCRMTVIDPKTDVRPCP